MIQLGFADVDELQQRVEEQHATISILRQKCQRLSVLEVRILAHHVYIHITHAFYSKSWQIWDWKTLTI